MGRYSDDDGFGFIGQVAAIAPGVFIGGLGAMLTWEQITVYRLEEAAKVAKAKPVLQAFISLCA